MSQPAIKGHGTVGTLGNRRQSKVFRLEKASLSRSDTQLVKTSPAELSHYVLGTEALHGIRSQFTQPNSSFYSSALTPQLEWTSSCLFKTSRQDTGYPMLSSRTLKQDKHHPQKCFELCDSVSKQDDQTAELSRCKKLGTFFVNTNIAYHLINKHFTPFENPLENRKLRYKINLNPASCNFTPARQTNYEERLRSPTRMTWWKWNIFDVMSHWVCHGYWVNSGPDHPELDGTGREKAWNLCLSLTMSRLAVGRVRTRSRSKLSVYFFTSNGQTFTSPSVPSWSMSISEGEERRNKYLSFYPRYGFYTQSGTESRVFETWYLIGKGCEWK